MDTIEDILSGLNQSLEDEILNLEQFSGLIKALKTHFQLRKGELINFEFYNEKRLKKARRDMLKALKLRDFNFAEGQHELEQICQSHLRLKMKLGIENSKFYFEDQTLTYWYFGTAKNDSIIREYLVYKNELWC